MSNSWSCLCSAQSRNLRNLRIPKLHANLKIVHWVLVRGTVAQSRDRAARCAQSRDSAISVACTIEPFEFPSYIKVRDVRNKLLAAPSSTVAEKVTLQFLLAYCILLFFFFLTETTP